MKPKLLIRIAAGCILFFALGHTIGHLGRKDTTNPKEQEVIRITTENKFDMFGTPRSYDENYTGMSINLIITLLALTVVVWLLSSLSVTDAKSCRNILIPIILCMFGFAATGFLYFFPVPAITCVAAGSLMLGAVVQLSKAV